MPNWKKCARWPECEREFEISLFAPGQKYCSPQCKYQAALTIQRKKRLVRPKRYAPCTICGAQFHPERNELYCSDECRKEIERRQSRARYRTNGGKRKNPSADSLAKLIKDPTDSWIVGHVMRLGQVGHDLKVDPSIWGEGVTFKTIRGNEILVVKNGVLVDENGKIRFTAKQGDG
mgnify:CR=1 FL=1